MTFSEFIKLLYPYCGNGKSYSDFLIEIISEATTEDNDPLFNKSAEYLKRICEGKKNITKKSASYILTNLKTSNGLDAFMYEASSEDALIELCKKFKPFVGNSQPQDITTKIVKLFVSILENIATENKNLAVSHKNNIIEIHSDGTLFIDGKEYHLPNKLSPPIKIEENENVYITELLAAYADAEKIEKITIENLPNKYKSNLIDQRKNYFNAESIRRATRDVFPKNNDQFKILKEETYDGICDTISLDYKHGYARLLSVLQQAAIISVDKSLLSKLPNCIGNSEKKGICHILVNEGKIKWVIKDE